MSSTAVLLALCPLLLAGGFLAGRRTAHPAGRSDLGSPVERATFETLHTASLAAPPLRAGLTEDSARKAARRLRSPAEENHGFSTRSPRPTRRITRSAIDVALAEIATHRPSRVT